LPGSDNDLFINTMEKEMNRKLIALTVTALFATSIFGVVSANPLPRTEIRDPVRGVSFYSIEISEKKVNSLEVIEGSFGDTDSLVVGISALKLDGSEAVDEYIFWLRHEGRLWHQFDIDQPAVFEVDGQKLNLEQLRASQPWVGASSRMFEKVEFRLDQAAFDRLVLGNEITITLRSENGLIEKTLTIREIERLREFRASFSNETGVT
jgi:hypothetical protein